MYVTTETHETQRDYWRHMRPKGTHETQRGHMKFGENAGDYWRLMGLRETNGTHETPREYWRLLETQETNGDS